MRVLRLLLIMLIAGLITGTLDALLAMLINYKTPPDKIWSYVASGWYGKAASTTPNIVVRGLAFHYFIAFCFSSAMLLFYPTVKAIFRFKYLIGVLYGLLVWSIMNLLVVPLSNTPKFHFHIGGALVNMLVLVLAIGIPSSLIAYRYYSPKYKK